MSGITVPTGRLRPIALAVIRDGGRILVFQGHDPRKGETFYRPLGGGIDFGERGADALRRELREELGVELAEVRYLGTLENIFEYDGRPGHEIVLVFEARFIDAKLYQRPWLDGQESGGAFRAIWKDLDDFAVRGGRLYPTGLLALIDLDGKRRAGR